MKKTALEWLVEQISYTTTRSEIISYHKDISKLVEQAKEMEKQQIVDFGYDIAEDLACGKYRDKKHMEERYNEFLTYNEEEDV